MKSELTLTTMDTISNQIIILGKQNTQLYIYFDKMEIKFEVESLKESMIIY